MRFVFTFMLFLCVGCTFPPVEKAEEIAQTTLNSSGLDSCIVRDCSMISEHTGYRRRCIVLCPDNAMYMDCDWTSCIIEHFSLNCSLFEDKQTPKNNSEKDKEKKQDD